MTNRIHQPERAIMGHCPDCKRVIIVENNREVWPLVECECGWTGGIPGVINRIRMERGGRVGES